MNSFNVQRKCFVFQNPFFHFFQIVNTYFGFQAYSNKKGLPLSAMQLEPVKNFSTWYDSGRHPQFSKWNLKTWLILHSELSFLTIPSFPYPSKRDFKSSVRELFAAVDASICVLDDNFNLLILIKWETTSRSLIQGFKDCNSKSK